MTDMRQYLLVLRRRRWWIAALVIVGVLLSSAYLMHQTPIYTSVSDVLVNAQQFGNRVGPLATQVSMPTEVSQVTSQTMGQAAAKQLPWWHGTIPQLLQHVTVTNPSNTLVLTISFVSIDPQHAKQGADAFANAYVEQRTHEVKPGQESSADALRVQIENTQLQIAAATAALKKDTPGSAKYLKDQTLLNNLKVGLAQAQTSLTNVNEPVGVVTSQGAVPDAPSSPKKAKTLGLGLMLGLLLGVIAAFVRDRVGDLPRDREEIGLILGAPVLAADQQEGAVRRRLRQWRGERAEGSWTSHRLLGLVLERWIGQERGGPPAFMMASPVSGPDTALVAAEASRALAWAGRRVICISSAIGDDSLSGEFELSNDVGFSSVVAGDVSVAGSARRIGLSDLSVIPSGPPSPRSAEVLATRGLPVLGSVVDQLKDSSDVVVVAGPPLLGPNGGVAISTVVDFVIVVISAKTRREELHEVRWRLAEMGVEVLGAVVTRQMSKHRIRHLRHVQSTSTAPAVRVPRDTTPIEPRVRPNGRSGANQPLPDVALELRGSARGTGARNASSGRTTKFAGSTSTNPSRQSSGRSRRRHS